MKMLAAMLAAAACLMIAPLGYGAQASDGMGDFEGFQASLQSRLRVAIVNGERRLEHGIVATEAQGEMLTRRGQVAVETLQGWTPETKATMVQRKAQFAILIKRVRTKKGKTVAHNFGPAFYSSWGENVQYTGAMATAEFEAYEFIGGKWKKAASWDVTSDRTALPGVVDPSKVKDGKYVVDPEGLAKRVVSLGISGGIDGVQHYGVAVPFGRSVEWVQRLDVAGQAEFWRRLSHVTFSRVPLDWRGLDMLAIEQWRRCEAETSPSTQLVQAIKEYCRGRQVMTKSVVAAERGLRERWRAAESAKLNHWRTGLRSAPTVFLNTEAGAQLNLSQSRMPRLISSRIVTFGKDDMQFFKAKNSPRRLISLSHGACVVARSGGGYKLVRKFGKTSIDADALDKTIASAFPSRWPSGS